MDMGDREISHWQHLNESISTLSRDVEHDFDGTVVSRSSELHKAQQIHKHDKNESL